MKGWTEEGIAFNWKINFKLIKGKGQLIRAKLNYFIPIKRNCARIEET